VRNKPNKSSKNRFLNNLISGCLHWSLKTCLDPKSAQRDAQNLKRLQSYCWSVHEFLNETGNPKRENSTNYERKLNKNSVHEW